MRVGQNPAKYVKDVAKPARVTAAVLNYIPFLSGFYSETLDVLKVCMKSLRENTKVPFDLMVFDNGSCPEVKEFLMNEQAEGNIQYLLLSEKNLGKGGAWNMILSGCPGEIIAYTDSDALFHEGWLEKSLELLETFPNVGMVTARPFRTKEEYITSTLAWGEKAAGASVEKGDFIPYEVFREFDLSLGQTEEEIRQHYETSTDYRLTYKGLSAIAGASHWQFVAKKEVLAKFLPFDMSRPMGQVKQLDQRMNEAGYLRLMPTEPLAMNMSNTLRGVQGGVVKEPAMVVKSCVIIDFPPIKKILLSLYDTIFRWYYDRRDS
ncbi:MAG: glycosyltransferase family A protein [Anaerolineaceae bacterium]